MSDGNSAQAEIDGTGESRIEVIRRRIRWWPWCHTKKFSRRHWATHRLSSCSAQA